MPERHRISISLKNGTMDMDYGALLIHDPIKE